MEKQKADGGPGNDPSLKGLRMNCIISTGSVKGMMLYRYRFSFHTDKEIELQSMGYKVSRALRGIFSVYTGGNSIYTLSKMEIPPQVNIDGIPVTLEGPTVEELDPQSESHRRVVHQHLKGQIGRALYELGFELQEGDIHYRRESISSGNIESHDAVTYQMKLTPTGRVMIFVDVQKRWICPLETFLGSLTKMTEKEKIAFMKDREVMVHRDVQSLGSRYVVDYIPARHDSYALDPVTKRTLYDYWANPPADKIARISAIRKKLGYVPRPDKVGVYLLLEKGTIGPQIPYPPEVLRLKIDLQDNDLLEFLDLNAEKEVIPAAERDRKIRSMLEAISLRQFKVEPTPVTFRGTGGPNWGTLDELSKDGYRLMTFPSPNLLFGNGGTTRFERMAINSALRRFGPFSDGRDVIVDLLLPQDADTSFSEPFFNAIADLYEGHRLGRLTLGHVIIGGASPASYSAKARDHYEEMKSQGESLRNRILIGILPTKQSDPYHHGLNRELNEVGVPSKCFKYNNYVAFRGRAKNFLYNVVACIYERTCPVGEAMWLLQDGAGGVGPTVQDGRPKATTGQMFVGFDVSRVPGHAEVASYAAVCEPHGRVLAARDKAFSGEYLSASDIDDILTGTASTFEHVRRSLRLPLTEEIVFFKDGTSRGSIQERDLEAGLDRAVDSLIEAGRGTKELAVHYVDVTKGIIVRLFSEDGKVPEGTCAINDMFEHPEAILITTDPFTGLAQQPNRLVLRKSAGIGPTGDIERIARQYFDLRFLHWETWMFQPGAAVPLHIVQHMAKQKAYGYSTIYVPK